MASFALNGGTTFPEGTSVSAYPRSAWPSHLPPSGAPVGSAAAGPATITGGTATFTGLLDNANYVAYASSPDRLKSFSTPPASVITDGGLELAYGEKADANFTTTTTPTAVDIGSGTSISFVAGTRPVAIRFGATDMFHTVANTVISLNAIRTDTSAQLHSLRGTHATANGRITLGQQQARMTGLTPGNSYTVKLQAISTAAGTMTVPAGPSQPIWIQAVEL